MEPTRRDFMAQAMIALPFLGLTLPEPAPSEKAECNIEPKWVDRSQGDWPLWEFDVGCMQTLIFTPGNTVSDRWYIRAGKVFRPHESPDCPLFIGTLAEAKAEAERFTLACLQKSVTCVEKIVYTIRRQSNAPAETT